MTIKGYIIVTLACALFFTLAGMAGQVVPNFTKPPDRGYSWMEGFVDDYIGYVSYVKEGAYGLNTFRIRSLPQPQPPSTVHLLYVWTGKVGNVLGLSAPVGYQLLRAVSGISFFILMTFFLVRITGNRFLGLVSAILAALSTSLGWYMWENQTWIYHVFHRFGFTDNVALRFASRPHYMVGALLFLLLSYLNLDPKSHHSRLKVGLTFVIGFILGTVHPSFALLLTTISAIMILWRILRYHSLKKMITSYLSTIAGLGIGMGVSYYFTHQYPTVWILSFEEYVVSQVLAWETIVGDFIAFGPCLWIGVVGLCIILIKTKGKEERQVYMVVWFIVQLLFFFWLYKYFRSERVRYIQSLYFIPMGYGTVVFINEMSKKLGRWILPLGVLLCTVSLSPTFYHDFLTGFYSNTNYRDYSYFVFPKWGMMEAYSWLDKKSPLESKVIASYEAASNIIIFSHNYVYGNKQGWPYQGGVDMERQKDEFFLGLWDKNTTIKFLQSNDIAYVYKGYQEADGFLKYPMYKPVYQNDDVTIYQILD